jgi:hypothetical protein
MLERREADFPLTRITRPYTFSNVGSLRHQHLSSYVSFLRSLDAQHAQQGIETIHFQSWNRRIHPSQDVKLSSKNALQSARHIEERPTRFAEAKPYISRRGSIAAWVERSLGEIKCVSEDGDGGTYATNYSSGELFGQ